MDQAVVLGLVPLSQGWAGIFWNFLGTRAAIWLYVLLVLGRLYREAQLRTELDGSSLRRNFVRPMMLVIFVSGTTDFIGGRLLKPLFHRPRPCVALQLDVERCSETSWSFPSNHAASTASVTMATGSPMLGWLSLLAGVSRVVQGQHYPSDVLAGWLLGAVVGSGMRRLWERWLPEDLWK
ncbi:MAG TPA: phosphatase PAP2 family protein [Myxococcota bacterium]|nr:phosphatase PAP2 family protein [Myxococcota bacterium]HNH50430.1 phosphatase PAP2 family protein [Myxococcota bacterium]